MSKIRKINVSEFEGSPSSIFPAGTLWVDLQNRLRVSDGITEGGISLAVDPAVIYPTSGNATAGIIFPNNPGGGSGDAASIKWYPITGEQMRLHIDVQNDNDDEVLIEASGPIKIKSGQDLWSFADNTITLPDTTTVSAGFISGGTDNHTAGIATYSSWNQVYAQDSSVGIQTSADGATYYTWGFDHNGHITFPNSTVQQTAWAGGRVVDVPGSSTGASGDLAGDIAFGTGYFYYCTANYSGTDIWKRIQWSGDTW